MHQSLNCVQPFATLRTIACQAPLSMGFSRQEHGNGLPCPSPGDLPHPGIESMSPEFSALAGGFFPCWAIRENPGLLYFFSIEGEGTAGRDWLVDNAWEGRSSIKAGGLCYLGPDLSGPSQVTYWEHSEEPAKQAWFLVLSGTGLPLPAPDTIRKKSLHRECRVPAASGSDLLQV